jgi:hypothetical protein
MLVVPDDAFSDFRPSAFGRDLAGELLTDASSWMVLLCYLDAAAWIGVPPCWPPADRIPATDFGRLTAKAIDAQRLGLPGRRDIRVAAILTLTAGWLAANRPSDSGKDVHDDALLDIAQIYVRALCPVGNQGAALALLDPRPLLSARARQRRRHPVRAYRHPQWPPLVDPGRWQDSLWWLRAQRSAATVPLIHAAAGLAAAVWSYPGALSDPIGVRHELRNRVIRARAWATSGDLYA